MGRKEKNSKKTCVSRLEFSEIASSHSSAREAGMFFNAVTVCHKMGTLHLFMYIEGKNGKMHL